MTDDIDDRTPAQKETEGELAPDETPEGAEGLPDDVFDGDTAEEEQEP